MPTIFETDHRLRNLTQTNATVHNAYQMALRDGDDTDALIMAVMVMAQTNETLTEALSECVKNAPPTVCVEARSVAAFYAEQKDAMGFASTP